MFRYNRVVLPRWGLFFYMHRQYGAYFVCHLDPAEIRTRVPRPRSKVYIRLRVLDCSAMGPAFLRWGLVKSIFFSIIPMLYKIKNIQKILYKRIYATHRIGTVIFIWEKVEMKTEKSSQ